MPLGEVLDSDMAKKWDPAGKGKGETSLLAETEQPDTGSGAGGGNATGPPVESPAAIADRPICLGPGNDPSAWEEDTDGWWAQFYSETDYPTMVCTTVSTYRCRITNSTDMS